MTSTQQNLLRPTRSKAETKADVTDYNARAIIGAEAEHRDAKTARLRQARLEHEANLAATPPAVQQNRAKASTPRRTRPAK